MKKETICWDCKNYAKCSWKDGIPVKGWKATPTIIANREEGGETVGISSFLVEKCPQFEQDAKSKITFKEIAEILGVSERHAQRIKKDYGIKHIKALLKDKGYKLYALKDEQKNHYYIEKI